MLPRRGCPVPRCPNPTTTAPPVRHRTASDEVVVERVPLTVMSDPIDQQRRSGSVAGNTSCRTGADRDVHIVLFGLMGTGKTTVGHLLANELGRPFVDSDSIVELRTGHLPPDLAGLAGLDELHSAELAALRHVLSQRDSVVFAAAASVVDQLEPGDLGSAWGVWLDTTPEVLAERVRHDRHERPLVAQDPVPVLTAQHERRAPLGRALAALTVSTDDRSPAEVVAAIRDAWRSWIRSSDASRT